MSKTTLTSTAPRVHPDVHAYQLKLLAAAVAGRLRRGVLTVVRHRGTALPIPTPPLARGCQLVVVTHRRGCPIAWDPGLEEWTYCTCDAAVALPRSAA